jgi:hypothetical protein
MCSATSQHLKVTICCFSAIDIIDRYILAEEASIERIKTVAIKELNLIFSIALNCRMIVNGELGWIN